MKAKMKAFANGIAYAIWEMEPEIKVDVTEIVKQNDMVLHALVFDPSDTTAASPTFYLEDAYEEYLRGHQSIKDIAGDLLDMYQRVKDCRPEASSFKEVMDYDIAKKGLHIRVLDPQMNKKFLEDKCWKETPDGMAIVACMSVAADDDGAFVTCITTDMVENFQVDEETVLKDAIRNAPQFRKAQLTTFEGAMNGGNNLFECDELPGSLEETGPLILKAEFGNYGAAALFYEGIKERLAELLGGGYYAIPSSQHEMLIVPDTDEADLAKFEAMLLCGNQVACAPQDVLTNHVFRINANGMMV